MIKFKLQFFGGRGGAGTRNKATSKSKAKKPVTKSRPLDKSVTSRQLKTHVNTALKAAGLTKADVSSSAIRGIPVVYKSGFDWSGSEITYVLRRGDKDNSKAQISKMMRVLSKNFKVSREGDYITIVGEYKKK